MVECLNCGMHRDVPDAECPRCSYIGWAWIADVDESLRQALRERTLGSRRRLRPV
jgi:hypothetical protein